jgi:hypothetical protein
MEVILDLHFKIMINFQIGLHKMRKNTIIKVFQLQKNNSKEKKID